MIKNILTILLLLTCLSAEAQLNEHFKEIKKTFSKGKQEDLSKISKQIKEAQPLFSSADFSKNEKAAGIFQENYRKLFLLYEKKLEKISKDAEGQMGSYVDYLLNEAKNSFRMSISDRVFAGEEKEKKTANELYKSAHQNEIDAIDFQSRAFGIINGWVTEDMTIPETNYSLEEEYDNTVTENFDVKYFSVSNASLPENYSFNRVNTNSGNTEVSYDVNYTDNINNSDNTYTNNYNNNVSKGTEFRIQIGTSILPANDSQISRLNPTELSVKTYKSKVYYKYTIGSFATFQEAKNYKNAYGLTETYITEYKDGKEVKFYYKELQ
ncbi:MAG: hypothetical protein L3J35_05405 [Bacteroidales bacterium]|nr:hypothetical protein [Bacteroidales bacterium]